MLWLWCTSKQFLLFQVTTKEQRTRYVAYLTISQFAGFAVTPGEFSWFMWIVLIAALGISILLSFLDFDLFGLEALEADQYSSAGYLLAGVSIVTIVVIWFVFVDPPKEPQKGTHF